ncbi:hypothetical protein Pst134EA_022384 [Puccinia striiformis f. sp. tritici]|uniref:hypothetical protein n=1 Tax=Puccinia striiformis f. sp. tritici TaxID=168172 RepID=UPI00200859C4|nr:hypothetical protein Pst134EA_022384 [Puccinia striiformis f. sp. tritici]KAH9454892.1 hypothetical protein Pst134EA_022384 [Puccinia striiformis f. sp. tritici]
MQTESVVPSPARRTENIFLIITVTTAAIPNLRLLSPQSLLDRITDNTIDQSTHAVDSGLNEQSLPQGDGEPNTVTQERLV